MTTQPGQPPDSDFVDLRPLNPIFWAIFEHTAPLLYRLADGLGTTANDILAVENVFTDFAKEAIRKPLPCLGNRKIGRFPEFELPKHIGQIEHRLIAMFLRRYLHAANPSDSPDQEMHRGIQRSCGTSDGLKAVEDRVWSTVKQLSLELRVVVVLGYYLKRPIDELSSLIGAPIDVVQQRLEDAKRELKQRVLVTNPHLVPSPNNAVSRTVSLGSRDAQ